jgi:hypothetical protein
MIARRAATAGSSLAQPLRGSGKLPVGRHSVKIKAVDLLWLDTRGYVDVVLEIGVDQTQRHRLYVLSFDKSKLSFKLLQFIKAVFGSSSVVAEWTDLLASDPKESFELLRGLTLGVTVAPSEGYALSFMADGFSVINAETSVPYATGFETAQDALEFAAAKQLPKSITQISEVFSVSASANCDAFRRAKTILSSTGT